MRTFSNAVPMGKPALSFSLFTLRQNVIFLPALEKIGNTISLLFCFKLRKSSKGNQLTCICLTQTKQLIGRNDQIDPTIDSIDTNIGIGIRSICDEINTLVCFYLLSSVHVQYIALIMQSHFNIKYMLSTNYKDSVSGHL